MALSVLRLVFGEGRYFIQKDCAEQDWQSGTHSAPLSVMEWDCPIIKSNFHCETMALYLYIQEISYCVPAMGKM